MRARQGDVQAAPPLIAGLDIRQTHPRFLAEWPVHLMASTPAKAGESEQAERLTAAFGGLVVQDPRAGPNHWLAEAALLAGRGTSADATAAHPE